MAILAPKQQLAVDFALAGHSIFLTGSAGVGKSYTLRYIIEELKEVHGHSVYVTASTGIAALAISGTTLHSFAGVGLGTAPVDELIRNLNKVAKYHWQSCKVLVIDEISMVSCDLFTKLDAIAKWVKQSTAPFGGIQLVLCGDFFQLPPVPDRNWPKSMPLFAFQSDAWKQAVTHTIELTKVFRQSEEGFVSMLNSLRRGKVPNCYSLLANCFTERLEQDRLAHTILYPLKVDVSRENHTHLNALDEEEHEFFAKDTGDPKYLTQLQKNCTAEDVIKLRIGAQVILLKSMTVEDGRVRLVNGSRGVVTDFDEEGYPMVDFEDAADVNIQPTTFSMEVSGKTVATRTQIPLALAWALSIHKSQGMSIDKVYLDLSRVFEYGQAYVALSRARTLAGLKLAPFHPSVIKAHPHVVQFYESLERGE
jgi:ATP-dependent DNA helicase PIF1